MERTVILYHGGCPDGFAGAYAAWKKYGDTAEYIPARHQKPPPEGLSGAHLIFIDFCYPKNVMDALAHNAASITVLDHHEGVKDVVEAFPNHIYDPKRSGATIAWEYFHPGTTVPRMLRYVEDGDLYVFTLPDSRPLLAYLYSHPFEFETWDTLVANVEDDIKRATMIERGVIFKEHADSLIRDIAKHATLVRFEGYECYFANTISAFTSDLGNLLARTKPPLALLAQARPDGMRVSLRSDGTIDVAALARTYGGNGHPASAAFFLAWGDPLPWENIPTNENKLSTTE